MHPVEHALWLIESRLAENPTLDDIARETGLSRYYLGRRFADATGNTLGAYVRARRLSEAAKALLAGAPSILDLALDAGYGSHEAFTRAFRSAFGTTPDALRARGREAPLQLQEPLHMTPATPIAVDPPTLADLPPTRYIGLARTYRMTELGGISGQWDAFNQRARLNLSPPPAAYGICRRAADGSEDMDYLCGVPAGTALASRDGMVEWDLPAMRVARFQHQGHVSAIGATTCSLFETALPQAGLHADGPVGLIEVYDDRFDPRSGFGPVGLWVPVRAG